MLIREFSIHNPGNHLMKLVGKYSSCTCVLFQGDGNTEIIADVLPRTSVRLKAGISVQGKVGDFTETIELHYESAKPVTCMLRLRGSIRSPPKPVVDQIQFARTGGSTLQRECVCSYQRKKEQKPIHLVDTRVLYETATEPSLTFDVGDVRFKSVEGTDATLTEIWSIPIAAKSRNKFAAGTAHLQLQWSDGSSSSVRLIGEPQAAIEVLQSRIFLETVLGSTCKAQLPVRLRSQMIEGPYELVSDADWCRAELDVQNQFISVTVDGVSQGRQKCTLILCEDGRKAAAVEVECDVKAGAMKNRDG